MANKTLFSFQAKEFIQELGRQAIISPNTMMQREMSYKGFGAAPVLTHSLFQNKFVVMNFNPVFGLEYRDYESFDENKTKRAQKALTDSFMIFGKDETIFYAQNWINVEDYYRNLSGSIRKRQRLNSDSNLEVYYLETGLGDQIKIVAESLKRLDKIRFEDLYIEPLSKRSYDFLDCFAEAIFQVFLSVANDFEGGSDKSWSLVLSILNNVFERSESQPAGMNPLQQRLALKILAKVADNMNGFYPAITRVLILFCWEDSATLAGSGAWSLLLMAFRFQLKKFPRIDKSIRRNYLPHNVTYNEKSKSFYQQPCFWVSKETYDNGGKFSSDRYLFCI